jgi:hypothetical protein
MTDKKKQPEQESGLAQRIIWELTDIVIIPRRKHPVQKPDNLQASHSKGQ